MELKEGKYFIPDGYTVRRVGKILHVYKPKSKGLIEGDYRCKDCVHYVEGYTSNVRWYKSIVCDVQPKREAKDGKMLYKAAQKYGKPCDKFELKQSV
jgi:hypothetical protein